VVEARLIRLGPWVYVYISLELDNCRAELGARASYVTCLCVSMIDRGETEMEKWEEIELKHSFLEWYKLRTSCVATGQF